MEIRKSSRHSKIIGEFGEYLICNLLSRSGLEVARVDHTGLDLLASDQKSGKLLGITVKSRTRNPGTEKEAVTLFSKKKGQALLKEGCKAFKAEAWLAVYVETANGADLYLTSLCHFNKQYGSSAGTGSARWSMGDKAKATYENDPKVVHVCLNFRETHWIFSATLT